MHWLIGLSMLSLVSSLPTISDTTTDITTVINDQKNHDVVTDFDFDKYKHNLTHERLYYDNLAQNCTDVFIISGGNTAANTGEQYPYNTTNNVLMWNYSLPGWQSATTQLAGSDGNGYSPWAGFGANVTNGTVCLIGAARQNSCINEWHPFNGKYHYLLEKAVSVGKNYGTPKFLWSQGECDVQYNTPNYNVYLSDVIYSFSNNTWFVSQTSYSPWTYNKIENRIREDQQSVVHQLNNAYAGPNTDALCIDYRFTDNTFNVDGQLELVKGWSEAYISKSDNFVFGDYKCFFKEIELTSLLFATLYVIGFILMGTACCVGSYYIIKNNNRQVNKVYYYMLPHNSEKTGLLDSRNINNF
jgi:hypothetical protein